MSFSLGLYDLFSYLIPGMLYIYVVNEYIKLFGFSHLDPSQLSKVDQSTSALVVVAILFAAFVIGHIFDYLASTLLYKLIYRRSIPEVALGELKRKYDTIDIAFKPDDWDILMIILRSRNIELTKILDKFQADSIMLRNLAFGFFLAMILSFTMFFQTLNTQEILLALAMLIAWGFASYRSKQFRLWFYTDIFQASLEYGSTLKKVMENNSKEKEPSSNLSGSQKRSKGK
ncbi:MAG: hypothetical protein HY867_09055 [Chloroflexi bacterium]|nr:hypothetical protein [Chloroflexota bacterium]